MILDIGHRFEIFTALQTHILDKILSKTYLVIKLINSFCFLQSVICSVDYDKQTPLDGEKLLRAFMDQKKF